MKPERIIFTNRELHMIGEYTAVVWNTVEERAVRIIDGREFTGYIKVRSGPPYIDFVDVGEETLRGEFTGYFENDDSPVDGGMGLEFARKIAAELAKAIEYLAELEG